MENTSNDPDITVIEEHATAIGLLCIYTAALDRSIVSLIEAVSGANERAIACMMHSMPDISQRAETMKRLALEFAPNDAWRDCTTGMMDVITNGIAPRRNRIVHDDWMVEHGAMLRIDRRVKSKKLQSFQPAQLIYESASIVDVGDIYRLTNLVVDIMVNISFMAVTFTLWKRTGKPPIPSDKAIELSKFRFPT